MAERPGPAGQTKPRPPTPLLFGRHMRAALNSDPRRARRIRRYIGQLRPAKCVRRRPRCTTRPPLPTRPFGARPAHRLYHESHGPPSGTPAMIPVPPVPLRPAATNPCASLGSAADRTRLVVAVAVVGAAAAAVAARWSTSNALRMGQPPRA